MKSFTLAAVACTPATGTLDSFARQPPQPDPMLRRLISTGERLWASLYAFLQLPGRPSQDTDSRVQLSALRIVLLSGITLEAAISLHSSWLGLQRGVYYILVIVIAFYLALLAAIRWSTQHQRLASNGLIVIVYAAGLVIATCVRIPEVQRLGYVFCYSAPLLAGLLRGYRLALALMALNLVPFGLAASGYVMPNVFGIDVTLNTSPLYIHGLLFTFFNFCLPLAVFRILSAVKHSQQHAKRMQDLYEDLFENQGTAVVVCRDDGRVRRGNRLFAQLAGSVIDDQPLSRWLRSTAPEGSAVPSFDAGTEWLAGEGRTQRRVVVRSRFACGDRHFAVSLQDVTELRELQRNLVRSQAEAEYLASHDVVTGLPRPEGMAQWLDRQRATLQAGMVIPVVSCGLGSLRQVNARFGMAQGNQFIVAFANALREAGGKDSYIARTRGSMLSIALPPVPAVQATMAVTRLRRALPHQLQVGSGHVLVELALGAALFPIDSAQAAEVMHRSGVAMELSREGSATAEEIGTPISERAVSRRIAIESALEQAIDDRELHVVYQPQVRSNGQLLGFEALVRWNSPALGAVSPAEFVPVAEQMGCVSRITDYILDEVCRQLALWMAAGAQAPRVAVNLSARDLDRDNLFETVLAAVGRYDVPVGALDLEVTETFLAERPERALAQLKLLREWSFKISIDDFGTGYSSLSKLADLPIDVLKIDRSFLLDLPGNARRERIVRSIVTLANNLHLQVVAEGVERGAQLRFLQMLGVDAYQGFLFHAPAPAEHWTPMLLGGLPSIEDLMLPGPPQFGHSLI